MKRIMSPANLKLGCFFFEIEMSPAKLKLEIKILKIIRSEGGKKTFIQCIATASVEFHEAVKMDLLLNLASALLGRISRKSIRTQEIV